MSNKLLLSNYVKPSVFNYGVDTINASSLWKDSYWGQNVVTAVIDTGCDIQHASLKENIIGSYNFTTDDNGEINSVTDYAGHGTHVAGIISSTNQEQKISIAPKGKLLILKVLGKAGFNPFENVIKAIQFAIEWRGQNGERVNIINLSLGVRSENNELREIVQKAVSRDIFVVAASGNSGDGSELTNEIMYPGYYEEVIQVSSINRSLRPSFFNSTNKNIDFLAPGEEIYSTYPNNNFTSLSGTSMAAPHVSGAIALLLSKFQSEASQDLNTSVYRYLKSHSSILDNYTVYTQGNGILKL